MIKKLSLGPPYRGKVRAWYLNLRGVSIVSFADQQSLDLLNRSGIQKIEFALQQIVQEVRNFNNRGTVVWRSSYH